MMWPVSQRYLDTIARSHTQLAFIEVVKDGQTVTTLQAGSIIDPNTGLASSALGGSVTVSSTTIRRNGAVQMLDPAGMLTPLTPDDLFAPYITELRVWIGVQYWDAAPVTFGGPTWVINTLPQPITNTEFVPVITLVITQPEINAHQINISGYDRMWLLGNFPSPYQIAKGTLISDAITNLLSFGVPGQRFEMNIPTTADTINGDVVYDADSSIADAVQQLAGVAGWKIACDPMGVFTAITQPSTDDDPDLVLSPGEFSVMMRPQRQIGSNDVNNMVVMTNEGGQNTPLRGVAMDQDPDSLTNVSRIGMRPVFLSDSTLDSQEKVDHAALNKLQSILGLSDAITVVMMPNHALDSDDILNLTDVSQGINGLNLISDNFTLPLRASEGAVTVQTRSNAAAMSGT